MGELSAICKKFLTNVKTRGATGVKYSLNVIELAGIQDYCDYEEQVQLEKIS